MSNMQSTQDQRKCLLCPKDDNEKSKTECIRLHGRHIFCWVHINEYIKTHIAGLIPCPVESCCEAIKDVDVRKVLSPVDVEQYEQCMVHEALAEGGGDVLKCVVPGCGMLVQYENSLARYDCPRCSVCWCLMCQQPHRDFNCGPFLALTPERQLELCQNELTRAEMHLRTNERENRLQQLRTEQDIDLISNEEPFLCDLCLTQISLGRGVKLRECHHCFCKSCIVNVIGAQTSCKIGCPSVGCTNHITEREVMALLANKRSLLQQYNRRQMNFIRAALGGQARQCRATNCGFLGDNSDNLDHWYCAKCQASNCDICKGLHAYMDVCPKVEANRNKKDISFIEKRIREGKVMECIGCKQLLQKVSGCNWVQCSGCGLEICWIRKMLRWGSKGRGDTSGGCRCGVGGRACHPDCTSTCTPHND